MAASACILDLLTGLPLLRKLFPNVYEGWLVVWSVALIVTMVGAAFFYGFGLMFTPIVDEFGWSNAAVSFAFSLRTEAGGLAAPLVGVGIDRIGPKRVLLAGVVTMALGVFAMSFMQTLWQFYGAMVIIAVGTSSAGGQVGLAATATWFERRRGRAMSVMTLGGGIAGTLVIGVAWLVDLAGWRGALRIIGIVVLLVGLPIGLNVRNRPAGHPQPMDGAPGVEAPGDGDRRRFEWGIPPRRALRTRAFVLLAIGTAGMGFGTTALVVHQVPFLESKGISSGVAGSTVAVFTLTSVIGRLGFGYLADRFDKRLVLATSLALTAIGLPLLALVEELWQAILVLMIIAPGFGGSIPVRPALVADQFGTRYFGTMNGFLVLVMTVGSFFGPLVVGRIVDVTDEYTLGWLAAAGVVALAVPAVLLARRPAALIERYGVPAAELPAAVRGGD